MQQELPAERTVDDICPVLGYRLVKAYSTFIFIVYNSCAGLIAANTPVAVYFDLCFNLLCIRDVAGTQHSVLFVTDIGIGFQSDNSCGQAC